MPRVRFGTIGCMLISLASLAASQDTLSGSALARSIEGATDDAARAALIEQVKGLAPPEAESFVQWATDRWEDGGWEHLAPALARTDRDDAAELLVRVSMDRFQTGLGTAALEALGTMKPEQTIGLLWPMWLEHRTYFESALVRSVAVGPTAGLAVLQEEARAAAAELGPR